MLMIDIYSSTSTKNGKSYSKQYERTCSLI